MAVTPGWYPDPAGQPGLFRWWDGRAWSAATTAHPATTPPPVTSPTVAGGMQATTVAPRRAPIGWILGVVAAVVVVAVLVVVAVRLLSPDDPIPDPPVAPTPGAPSSSAEPECPSQPSASPTGAPASGGRVTSGKLSYAELGSPFSAPYVDSRVPFGRDVRTQSATVEDPPGGPPWAAAVTIATLTAGDGFYGPEQGAKLVARCIVGTFYGDNEVGRKDTSSRATTVDGYSAWLIESTLSYDIPNIKAKTELLLVLVVDTRDGNAGLFYGSVPDSAPQLVAPARKALTELHIA